MNGYEYEFACAEYLRRKGFSDVRVTKASGDQGADILARRRKITYAIQCKYYAKPVGNKAVQEVYAGATYYGCDRAMVITNQTFTKGAKELANSLGVELLPGVEPRRKRFGTAEVPAAVTTLAMVLLTLAMFIRPQILREILPEVSDERLMVSLGATAVAVIAFWTGNCGFGLLLGAIGAATGAALTGLPGWWKTAAIAVGCLICAACILRMLLRNRYTFLRVKAGDYGQGSAGADNPEDIDDVEDTEGLAETSAKERRGKTEAAVLLYETLKLAEESLAAADRETLLKRLESGEESAYGGGLERWEDVIAAAYRYLIERENELEDCGELPSARQERLYGWKESDEDK